MALIKQFRSLPEQPPQVWKDVCEQTALLHRRGITDEEIDALCDYTWAIFRKENQWYVFKVKWGNAVQTPVTVGLRNDDWAEIVEGLSAEDTIVAELKNDLEDGVRLTSLD